MFVLVLRKNMLHFRSKYPLSEMYMYGGGAWLAVCLHGRTLAELCGQIHPDNTVHPVNKMKKQGKTPAQTAKLKQSKIAKDLEEPTEYFDNNTELRVKSKMAPARKRMLDKDTESQQELSESESDCEEDIRSYLKCLPSKAEIKNMLQELTTAIRDEMRDLKKDVISLSARTDTMEKNHEKLIKHNTYLHKTVHNQAEKIDELERQMEDFENRSRRINIRIRGIPETVTQGELKGSLQQIFNNILSKDLNNEIKMDRYHRVAKTKNAPPDSPRDVLCALHDYTTKETILMKAREMKNITFEDSRIILFQDLSWRTLNKRRQLKPLTDLLKEKGIQFKWGFPFSLSVRNNGQLFILRNPKDTDDFCKRLDIERIALPGWDIIPSSDANIPKATEFWSTPLKHPRRSPHTPRLKDREISFLSDKSET
uniref:L1 transposable element RRM domain-containing protein n=1 Tax=Xenopus tropicalis TaxID=8364 RepID=A0A803K9I3_XENTR